MKWRPKNWFYRNEPPVLNAGQAATWAVGAHAEGGKLEQLEQKVNDLEALVASIVNTMPLEQQRDLMNRIGGFEEVPE